MEELIVMSLGGSAVVPDHIDVEFLKNFKELVVSQIEKGKRFILIVGGGKTAREYQNAATDVGEINDEDSDWLGIHATRLNGHLLRTMFKEYAHKRMITDPNEENIEFQEKILIAAGWKPGWSTDYDAVLLAKNFGTNIVVNLSNIEYVYDSDPHENKNAKPLPRLSWKEYRAIVGDEWHPGLNAPFDPVASKVAQESGMKVVILKAIDIENLRRLLDGEEYKGTLIS